MSIKAYTDIIITDNHFSVVKRDEKPQEKSALTILSRIEEVMEKRLKYAEVDDEFSSLSRSELYMALKQRAKDIGDGYVNKANALSLFRKIFGGVSKKKKIIQATCSRIANLTEPYPILELPNETVQHVLGFLSEEDLSRVAQGNWNCANHVKMAEIHRAREYGYQGFDFVEAKNYLHTLYQFISTLVKDGHIPEKYVVRKQNIVDSRATLRKIKQLDKNEAQEYGSTLNPLFLKYAKQGQINLVKALLLLRADLNARDRDGRTALALAAWKGKEDVVRFLIEKGAAVNTTNVRGNTPLISASSPEITKCLLANGANTMLDHAGNFGKTALHFAAQNGRFETVKLLAESGADLNARDRNRRTALALAALKGKEDVVRFLIEKGAAVNTTSSRGNTPLISASSRGFSEITKCLLANGANTMLDHAGNYGFTALHFAAFSQFATRSNQLAVVKVLIKYSADRTLLDNRGRRAYELTRWYNFRLRRWLR